MPKIYDIRKRLSKQAKERINDFLNLHKNYRKSFNWTPPPLSSGRRLQEKQFKALHKDFCIITSTGTIDVVASLELSSNNYYYKGTVYLNKQKKDIRTLKKLLK